MPTKIALAVVLVAVAILSVPGCLSGRHEAAVRLAAANNLRQLGLAMLQGEMTSASHTLPAQAILSSDGKPLLSWRVAMLPSLEEIPLYKEFHLDEPWDSENNKKLLDRMPDVFKSPGRASGNKTAFLVLVGKGTPFEGLKGMSLRQITDSASNTIMIVEAREDQAVPWTKPDDLNVDLEHPWTGLQDARDGGFFAVFCDGAVRFIGKSTSPQALKAAFTANGNEPEVSEIRSE